MRRICLDEVCRQVSRRQSGPIEYANANGIEVYPYNFSDFEKDVFAEDFISSRTTARSKWTGLLATGVVEVRGDRTFLNVRELRTKSQGTLFKREVYRWPPGRAPSSSSWKSLP